VVNSSDPPPANIRLLSNIDKVTTTDRNVPPGLRRLASGTGDEKDEDDTKDREKAFSPQNVADFDKLQYLQITTLGCSSEADKNGQPGRWDTVDAPPRLVKYHKNNNINLFTFSRQSKKHKAPEPKKGEKTNEFRDLWIVKTYLVTADPLPALCRRAEVIERIEVLMCPIENAIYNIVSKNADLKEIITEVKAQEKPNTGPLSMQLAGVIDAAVQGGVEKYREAFFDGHYLEKNPTHGPFVQKFKTALSQQLVILHQGLEVFGSKCDKSLMPLLEHLTKTFKQMRRSLNPLLEDADRPSSPASSAH